MLIGEAALDQSLVRSFTGRLLLGEFDPPEDPLQLIPTSCLDNPAHQELAREAARQSIVLFKNENRTLPLDKTRLKRTAVIGPMAGLCQLGNYSGGPQFMVSPLKAINECFGIRGKAGASRMSAPVYAVRRRPANGRAATKEAKTFSAFAMEPGLRAPACCSMAQRNFMPESPVTCPAEALAAHLDSLDGPLIAKLDVPKTGGGQTWLNISAPISPVIGEHTVFLRFAGGKGDLFKITSFSLTPAAPVEAEASGTAKVVYAMGCGVVDDKDQTLFDEAVKAARESDVALVFVGVNEQVDKESHDRADIRLSGAQHDLVKAVYAANPRTILVVSSNAPVAINWEQENLPAIVGGMFLGEQQGNALVDVLFGNYNPGGKVSTTWYRQIEDLPDFHDYNMRKGRTYLYFRGKPLYPFGYGLSYTTFEYKNLRLSGNTLQPKSTVTITFEVTNTGHREGDEIVQVYVRCPGKVVERPLMQLVNFDRLHLKAGETRTASLALAHDHQALRYWDENTARFAVETGPIEIMVGASSADIKLRGKVQLTT